MENPTINKIIIEKTDSGINIEFTLTDDTKQIMTDLDKIELKCDNSNILLTEFSVFFNTPKPISDEVSKNLKKLLDI